MHLDAGTSQTQISPAASITTDEDDKDKSHYPAPSDTFDIPTVDGSEKDIKVVVSPVVPATSRSIEIPTTFAGTSIRLYTRLREAGKVDEDNEMLMVGHLPKSETIDDQEFHFRYGNGAGGDAAVVQTEPIGRVVDYFYRVEFQQRGSPHVHCLFWVDGAPRIGVNPDEEVTAFVDKYVTCETPTDDDDLLELVNSVQRHSKRHSKTCRKGATVCRFNFPRPPSMRTFIKKKEPKQRCKKCDLKDEDANCTCDSLTQMTREQAKAIMTAIKKLHKMKTTPMVLWLDCLRL
ncbi:hypothetical protein WMY93_033899 [Mugilogobius chulae]|uniref:Helitron helicase-like domain-containing protein n=1 Tax=Mugilogobius chulae TaxID=88201 RepID=A0AAW0MMD0_9GOBI